MTKTKKDISSLLLGVFIATLVTTPESNAQEDDSVLIEEITVLGESPLTAENDTGSRLGLTVKETPATVEVIEGDTIRERLDTSVMEAVTRSAGFTNNAHHAVGGQEIAARGFSGQGSVTKLFDGTHQFTAFNTVTFPFDTWGVERIEVLKGPASVLYGEGGIGGAYNIVPKRPQQEQSGDLRISTGGDDTRFIGVGLTGGLTDNLAYRLDYSNNQSDNWVDRADSKTEMISASLAVQVTEDFALTARYDYGYQEPMPYSGTPLVDGDPGTPDVDDGYLPTELLTKNYDVSDSVIRHKEGAARIKADWNISERLFLQSELFRLDSDRLWQTLDYYQYDPTAGTVRRESPLVIAHDIEHSGFRSNLGFDAGDGGRKLKTSLGFEINDVTFIRPTNWGGGNPNGVDWANDYDVVGAFNFDPRLFSDLTSAVTRTEIISDVAQAAVFAEGQVGLTDPLTLVLGLRHEQVETTYSDISNPPTFDQSVDALTGRAGLVFDLNDTTVLYAQYATGATHPRDGGIVRTTARDRELNLTETEQIEVGIKQSLLDNRLHWTLALFDIVKNGVVQDHPDSMNPDDRIIIPEKTSQGVEFSLALALTNALKVTANGALVDVDRTSEGIWGPVEAPEETYNLGLAWAPLDRLQLLADARHVGERFHPFNPIPSYTVVDTSARWHFNQDLSMVLRIDNVFDELYASAAYYYPGMWLVGKPRTFNLSLDYHF